MIRKIIKKAESQESEPVIEGLSNASKNKRIKPYSKAWHLLYAAHPPVRAALQIGGRHKDRHPYLLGLFNVEKYTIKDLAYHLIEFGFEKDRLAWKEEGEVLSMRKVDGKKFQWHIRMYKDGEVRAHYEYSPEVHPLKHLKHEVFKDDSDFLIPILGDYIKK